MSDRTMARQVLLFIWFLSLSSALGQVSYSIPEEMAKGSLVGNIVQDLGLDLKRLKSGKARIYTGDSAEYIELNKERGVLLIKERIDREALCGQTTPCALHFQIILENPMEFFSITIEIIDINDNTPSFEKSRIIFRISESAVLGSKFMLEPAIDLDVGINGLQSYMLKPTDNFNLIFKNQPGDGKNVEIVLKKPLDREKQHDIKLVLTAIDGGDPQLSGSIEIHITVLDVNDNAPVFLQSVYKATVTENAPKDTVVSTVSATDPDEGINSKIEYSIANRQDDARQLFGINQDNGQVTVVGIIDFEKARSYEISVQASDHGGLTDSCKIIVDVIDINDNKPVINIMSKTNVIAENPASETVVTMINVQDLDSGENGKVQCSVNENIPFTLRSTNANFFSLVTDGDLDRERESEYNISVTCADEGVPSLSSSVTLSLQISDVNDNAPVFDKSSYEASVQENNTPGLSIFTVRARDTDFNQNARVSYILEDSSVNGVPYNYEVCRTTDSRKSDLKYGRPCSESIISLDSSGTQTLTHAQRGKLINEECDDQHVYNYEVCRTTDSRKSDLKYVRPCSKSIISLGSSGTQTLTHAQRGKLINKEFDDQVRIFISSLCSSYNIFFTAKAFKPFIHARERLHFDDCDDKFNLTVYGTLPLK
ncbi:protocadherin beta-16-like [Sinocyclocheilus rhinocerous]|uniref:protocadherin beta-16-like n=1 Tax=Sinocyclocheilus rhinocerous TaxID=307959 RepID=UPI0007B8DE1D|nr:PREDICTED: protocadherin beta-16-like [Sinocyclocheilus rhinocerous]